MNYTLYDVSEGTKISVNFLQAIETNEFKKLPRGIFAKLFIRSYAKFVSLDEAEIVRQYYNQIALSEAETSDRIVTVEQPTTSRKKRSLFFLIVIFFFIILIAVSIFLVLDTNKEKSSSPDSAAKHISESTQDVYDKPAPQLPATSSESPSVPSGDSPPPSDPLEGDVSATDNFAKNELVIEIQAREYCWVNIVSQDGMDRDFILNPGELFRETLYSDSTIIIGNAGGITLTINGNVARPLGSQGQVVELSLSPTRYHHLLDKQEDIQ